MSGNTFGRFFTLTSFGESHGPCMGGVVDGMPSGIDLTQAMVQKDLDRRRPGRSAHTTQRNESDTIQILSGLFEGKTLGSSIGFIIPNENHKSKDYEAIKDTFRPGHGDYTYFKKYGIRDYRGGGRASARETVVRVAGGAMAKAYLQSQFNITIQAYLTQMGPLKINREAFRWDAIETNDFFCPDPTLLASLEDLITTLREEGDSCGAKVEVVAKQVPVGLGEPVYHRLDADLASAMMSINAVKAVAIGEGFDCIDQRGSQFRDEMTSSGFLSSRSGGILAGISTGQDICVQVALKPASSILIPGRTVTESGVDTTIITQGRHDPCVGLRAIPIVEAMMALVLADHALQCFGNRNPIKHIQESLEYA